MKVYSNALGQLFQIWPVQLFEKLRLPNENNLQNMLFVVVNIGKDAKRLQPLRIQILRLVDNQNRVAIRRILLD